MKEKKVMMAKAGASISKREQRQQQLSIRNERRRILWLGSLPGRAPENRP
jgi:hypothetical protein